MCVQAHPHESCAVEKREIRREDHMCVCGLREELIMLDQIKEKKGMAPIGIKGCRVWLCTIGIQLSHSQGTKLSAPFPLPLSSPPLYDFAIRGTEHRSPQLVQLISYSL